MISPTENNQRMKFEASPEVDTQEKSKNKRRLVKFFSSERDFQDKFSHLIFFVKFCDVFGHFTLEISYQFLGSKIRRFSTFKYEISSNFEPNRFTGQKNGQ